MKNIYENARTFISNNYNGDFDEKTLDVMTVSIMSLFIRFPDITQEKLPDVLKKLKIFYGDKAITEMVTANYSNFPTEEIDEHTSAFVVRALEVNDNEKVYEEWSMYVSTSHINDRIVDVISKFTHELIHLLRFNGIVETDSFVKVRDGISVSRYNKNTKKLLRKYKNFEEGIVEYFTINALNMLYDFVLNEDVSFSPALSEFKRRCKNDLEGTYDIERLFLGVLINDTKFSQMLEYSFVDKNEPTSLITYYNDVMDDSTAFDVLSKELDSIVTSAAKDDKDSMNAKAEQLMGKIQTFLMKSSKRKRY